MCKKAFIPLWIIEGYLIGTLVLLKLGPLNFRLHNKLLFTFFIVLYHLAFIIGYLLGGKKSKKSRNNIFMGTPKKIQKRYKILLLIVFYIWIIVTRNTTHGSSYFPSSLLQNAIVGIINPAQRYYLLKDKTTLFNGNPLVTGTILLIYFFYYCFPAMTIWYWKYIKLYQKMVSIILIILMLLTGFVAGINAILFHVLLALSGGIAIHFSKNNKVKNKKNIIIILALLGIGIFYFIHNIGSRLGEYALSYYVSKSADISISPVYDFLLDSKIKRNFLVSIATIQYYLCQGYYGMSLALEETFTSTFGLGHSFFLATSFDKYFGTNIISRTYQEKITEVWSRTINWHSFYSQMANDVSFYGVILIMFILGIMIRKIWSDIIYNNNPVAKLLLVTLIPVFIFMPMNNQMGNLYGTFFSVWVLIFLWILTRRRAICFANKFKI